MPRQSHHDTLQRWMEMDRKLSRSWVEVKKFARRWKVDERRIREDIAMFRTLGYEIDPIRREGESGEYAYPVGQAPMFTCNQRR